MHADQVSITTDVAGGLIRNQFPQLNGEDIVRLHTAGTVNAIFRIGSRHAARFPIRRMDAAECLALLESEAAAVRELSERCPFRVPKTIGLGRPDASFPLPWLVQTWIEGDPATPDALSHSTDFMRDLAHLVTSLRAADVNGRRFDGQGRGGHLPDHDDWMEVCFSHSEGLLDVARLRRLWSELRVLASVGYDVMSHKDLIPANLLVEGERLVGVLDGGAFGPADPALDLIVGWHMLDRERRSIFRTVVQADQLVWRRSAAWAFVQAMGLVWYYRESNPIMSALGESTLTRLLEDEDISSLGT